ncbi:peptidylprolyl isomerase [Betaproteobacteria bacterium GR16-43]|nr:peptidylprolyl isomerase [Betaproteobacteria bacterium GR16-43]
MRRLSTLLAALLLSACTLLAVSPFEATVGPADPTRFDRPATPLPGEEYATTIQPLLDRRCVVCHACYDAACQLKAQSWEGLVRGASKVDAYDQSRLLAAPPQRLYVDAERPSEWRGREFFSVLNERAQTPEANRTAGLLSRLLALKQQHPGPNEGAQPAALKIASDRAPMCPAEAQIEAYERANPLGGMPFGLPALSPDEHQRLSRWIERGAPYEGRSSLPAPFAAQVENWERFFNGDSAREQLFARYAFEHLFVAHLYFDEVPGARRHFRLVRSSTPPGTPVKPIVTRRPVEDPQVPRVYYRLAEERESLVAKTFMPYALNAQRMARWRSLFIDPSYTVDKLPGYSPDDAANPFITFAALPVGARYRFMLDEAQYTIMGFVKGPVCRGQVAVNVIEDRFWVAFISPDAADDLATGALFRQAGRHATLPSGSSNSTILATWIRYGEIERDYLKARTDFFARNLGPERITLDSIWDGEGRNANAALTISRHFDNASVMKGFVGDTPKTAWIIGYPLLERIHYLLVADYDVYGNVGHQLNSRLYMDYLRGEGEFNFLAFLPLAQRMAVRDYWYRGSSPSAREMVYGGPVSTLPVETGVRYRTSDARTELMVQLKSRLGPVLDANLDLTRSAPPEVRGGLASLGAIRGAALQWMPENALLSVTLGDGSTRTYTLMRDTGHENVSHLIEKHQLLPEEDTLTVVPGIAGAYPNAFYRMNASQLGAFADAVRGLRSEADYSVLSQRFAVRRTDPAFWAFSDRLHEKYAQDQPGEAGVLDYNRLENR